MSQLHVLLPTLRSALGFSRMLRGVTSVQQVANTGILKPCLLDSAPRTAATLALERRLLAHMDAALLLSVEDHVQRPSCNQVTSPEGLVQL